MISYRNNPDESEAPPVSGAVEPWPVFVVTNRADMAAALATIRRARGMTCEDLDAHAGFSDRYTAKLEHPESPSGRKAIHISAMGELWVDALDYRLLLVPSDVVASFGPVFGENLAPRSTQQPVTPAPYRAPPRPRPLIPLKRLARHG